MVDVNHWLWPYVMKAAVRLGRATELSLRLERTEMLREQVQADLERALGPERLRNVAVKYTDKKYRSCSLEWLRRVMEDDWSNAVLPQDDYQDCDDYALAFKVFLANRYRLTAVGYVHDESSWHAYNVAVLADGSVVWIEPQEDRIVSLGDWNEGLKAGYALERGLILL